MWAPTIGVIVAVLASNFMGDGLRDAADPYTRQARGEATPGREAALPTGHNRRLLQKPGFWDLVSCRFQGSVRVIYRQSYNRVGSGRASCC